MGKVRADYGWDAPGIMLGLLAAGVTLIGASAASFALVPTGWLAALGLVLLGVPGLVLAGLGTAMVVYGLVGKRRVRDRMLGSLPWAGGETVLDVGTGAGLLLVGAAKRLTTGRAIGIDIWSAKDLSNNNRASTERNVAIEGVGDRVELLTADARRLPMPDGTFDRVVSLLCLHNIDGKDEQRAACREIARVLKPGGLAVIGDYVPTSAYASAFAEAGLAIRSSRSWCGTALSLMWVVVAEKPR